MASKDITRRINGDLDPFAPFRTQFGRLFDDFFGSHGHGEFRPDMDVRETEKEFVLSADLPGIKQDDISLELQDDMLVIRGERKDEATEDSENRHVFERRYGTFERSMRLPFTPEDDAVRADFADGVLTVTINKPAETQEPSRKIPIGRH